ncbi:MAG: hypothetical protein AUJ96_20220 [Armatimonadetes bacterium CG2_30_66_41]|nr:MAG: hypothetical protein AUJ96_20220 [Armatimonadetes bacterium CG2_30_66_41]
MKLVLPTPLLLSVCTLAAGAPTDDFLSARLPFESSLNDASGKDHNAVGDNVKYAEGKQGQAVKLDWQTLQVPNSPDLQLAPGLTLDCWVYFDEKPTGYQQFVYKDSEYQLRLDDQREGGRFSFFVYLDGWEPRVSVGVPVAGKWYHLVAKWTGTEATLEVNDEKAAGPRIGAPKPTDNPLQLGKANCRLDEVKLRNPSVEQTKKMAAMVEQTPAARRVKDARFGAAAGWQGWQQEWGATMSVREGTIDAQFPNDNAMLVNPALDVDVGENTWVCLEVRSPTAKLANLTFVTDHGSGLAVVPVWNLERTSFANLVSHPAWRGRLKLLGLSVPGGGTHQLRLAGLRLSEKPEGKPFFYVRNLAPGRAILRAGRDEQIIAVARNLGVEAKDVRAELRVPAGVRLVDEPVKSVDSVPYNGAETFAWTVRAERSVSGEVEVLVGQGAVKSDQSAGSDKSDKSAAATKRLALRFEPPCGLPTAAYVPPPTPAKSTYLTLMHYCPLWKAGTHYGWEKIEPWPERKPALGWYDEGTPEVADWHIKYALEHGIQGFIYCWYRSDFSPEIHQILGHAIHDGLLKAKYLDQFKFSLMWENGCAKGVKDRDDLMDNVLPFWIKNYFTHPSYVKVDNKPVLFVWRPERVAPELGGSEATRKVLDEMRAECRKHGFDGLWIVGCTEAANEGLLKRLAEEGWDATSAYATWSQPKEEPGRDIEGIATVSNRAHVEGEKDIWLGKKAVGALPDIVSVMQGWDPRPWHGAKAQSYWADPSPAHFRTACQEARKIIDATPGNGLDKRLVVFDNWDEFGEGHYLEPTTGFGFQYVDVIREVFCDEKRPCQHVIPEDVGLAPPEHVYLRQREILGIGVRKERKVIDNLVAWWSFDNEDEYLARDSSQGGFDGVKQDVKLTEGVRGKGFRCDGGSVSLAPHELLFPPKGISVELWLKTDMPDQGDRWILNTVGAANTGYRLGLGGGALCWQIPETAWSHLLADPDPVPLSKWTHVAATYDRRTMRLYVNGKERGSLERLGAVVPSENKLCLGSYGQGDQQHNFVGVIDEVKLYDRALTPTEVEAHYRQLGVAR